MNAVGIGETNGQPVNPFNIWRDFGGVLTYAFAVALAVSLALAISVLGLAGMQ
jgi:hypothetical protein